MNVSISTVRELGAGLPVGASRRALCPKCRGGNSGELSLSVSRLTDGVVYKCHRASCDVSGFRPAVPGIGRPEPAQFVPRPYPYSLTIPPDEHFLWELLRTKGDLLTAASLGVYVRKDEPSEVVWSVQGLDRFMGHISRKYPEKRIRVWREVEGPFHNWFLGPTMEPMKDLWIVEDNVSAARIYLLGHPVISLLGTHFSLEAQRQLTDYLNHRRLYPRIHVALDPDAYGKSTELARELTFRTGRVTMVVPTVADPKDLPLEELKRILDS